MVQFCVGCCDTLRCTTLFGRTPTGNNDVQDQSTPIFAVCLLPPRRDATRRNASQLLERSGWVPKVPQLTGQGVIDEKCGGTKICVIAALPHILDSGKAGRCVRPPAFILAASFRQTSHSVCLLSACVFLFLRLSVSRSVFVLVGLISRQGSASAAVCVCSGAAAVARPKLRIKHGMHNLPAAYRHPALRRRRGCPLVSVSAIREEYIEKVRGAAKKSRNPYLSVIWTEGGAQPALEEATGLTFGYPAVVAISVEKKARKEEQRKGRPR